MAAGLPSRWLKRLSSTLPSQSRLIEVPLGAHLVFPKRSRQADFSALPCATIVRLLARSLVTLTNEGGPIKSRDSVSPYISAIGALARWLGDNGHGHRRLDALDVRTIRTFFADTSCSWADETSVRVLLQRAAELDSSDVQREVVRLVEHGRTVNRKPDHKLISPISAGEAARLRRASRLALHQTEQRMREGEELLAMGADPVQHGWTVKNVLWLLDRDGPTTHAEIASLAGFEWGNRHRAAGAPRLGEIHDLLFPRTADLVPYALLLGLMTGLPPESIDELKVGCCTPIGASITRLRYVKRRGSGEQVDNFDSGVGRLVARLERMTDRARGFASETDASSLWLHQARGQLQGHQRIEQIRNMVPPVARFLEAAQLVDDNEKPLVLDRRQLRKYFSGRQRKHLRGDPEAGAGPSQSSQVAADHYFAATIEDEQLSQIIEGTMDSFVRSAENSRSPTVLDAHQLRELEEHPRQAAEALSVDEGRARTLLLTEERDVALAKCKDDTASPYAPAGHPCQAPAWGCLLCGQALITPKKLSNLLRWQDTLNEHYEMLPQLVWEEQWGEIDRALRDIFARFSEGELRAARDRISTQPLFIRPEDRSA